MMRRITVFSVSLVIVLALGFQSGTPKINGVVANVMAQSIDPTPVVPNSTTPIFETTPAPSVETTPVAPNGSTPRNNMAPDVAAATPPSIDTTSNWDGATYISSFGMPNTATYGQTLTMTETATLTQFSFYMKQLTTTIFRGYVFAWDGTKATGDPLFESAPMSTTQGTNFEEVVFYIPSGVVLNAGQQYVLAASTSKDPAQPPDAGKWGALPNNTAYTGGQFYFLNNGSDATQWASVAWSTIAEDLAFKAILVRPASIDTTLNWNRSTFISFFGVPNTATYGQTITMPGSGKLFQFSFYIFEPNTTIFRGYVFAWDGTKATGAPLFSSPPMNTQISTTFQEVVFNIPDGLFLKGGQQYILFASTSKDPGQPNSNGKWGALPSNTAYTGGQFYYLNNGSDATQWTSEAWSTFAEDLAFRAKLQLYTYLPNVLQP
ncbi:MAG TPA: hypothetical protein VMT46_17120 [Anaerolineaceae bacterium]|nr:hypothetical protein [Anaerolineaceae bacterium]